MSRPHRWPPSQVLLTSAFYTSYPCLVEVHKATRARTIQLIPLRCEAELPPKEAQWPTIEAKEAVVLGEVRGAPSALPLPRPVTPPKPCQAENLLGCPCP